MATDEAQGDMAGRTKRECDWVATTISNELSATGVIALHSGREMKVISTNRGDRTARVT